MNSNVVVLMISVGLSASVAGAAPDAGAKARGSYNFRLLGRIRG